MKSTREEEDDGDRKRARTVARGPEEPGGVDLPDEIWTLIYDDAMESDAGQSVGSGLAVSKATRERLQRTMVENPRYWQGLMQRKFGTTHPLAKMLYAFCAWMAGDERWEALLPATDPADVGDDSDDETAIFRDTRALVQRKGVVRPGPPSEELRRLPRARQLMGAYAAFATCVALQACASAQHCMMLASAGVRMINFYRMPDLVYSTELGLRGPSGIRHGWQTSDMEAKSNAALHFAINAIQGRWGLDEPPSSLGTSPWCIEGRTVFDFSNCSKDDTSDVISVPVALSTATYDGPTVVEIALGHPIERTLKGTLKMDNYIGYVTHVVRGTWTGDIIVLTNTISLDYFRINRLRADDQIRARTNYANYRGFTRGTVRAFAVLADVDFNPFMNYLDIGYKERFELLAALTARVLGAGSDARVLPMILRAPASLATCAACGSGAVAFADPGAHVAYCSDCAHAQ